MKEPHQAVEHKTTKRSKLHQGEGEDGAAVENVDSEERRLRRRLRRAQKLAKHLEELGLDENGNELDNFSLDKYPVREFKFTIPMMRNEVALNPTVTLIAIVCLWGLVLWCTMDPDTALAKLAEWRTAISLNLTWFIQGTKVAYFVYLLFLVWRYGHVKLGNKKDKPEFSTLTYFSMILSAGVSNSLLVYSASEPLSHQKYHFFATAGYRSQDEIDMFAINMTVTDWGVGGWAPFTLVAIAMSLAAYRLGLPMTFRSCFFPILGAYTWGWIGDVIDGFTIVATLAGIFTNLGLASMNFVAGFIDMKWIDADCTEEQIKLLQNCVVWVLSILALVSVVSGLHGGIKVFCLVAMTLGTVLLLLAFFLDDTKYLLNLQVQELGTYLQSSILQLNFWTDAFGQLREGSGRAVDGKAAEQWWYSEWLNFGQSWWVATSAVLGQFICSISRGRRIWEVALYSLAGPVVFSIVWFCVWGGIALRQARQALELESLGVTLFNNSAHFMTDSNEFCYDVPQEDILVDGEVLFTNHLPGVTPVCKFDEDNPDSAIFHVLDSFSFEKSFGRRGLGPVLCLVFMIACAVFFITSAGAISLIVDKMASSGRKNDHLARRVFWLVTAAALSSALLSTGGEDALGGVQATMMICGVPCAILLCYVMQSVTLMCRQATNQAIHEYQVPDQAEFSMPVYGGILNTFEYVASFGQVSQARLDQGIGSASAVQTTEFIRGLVIPFVTLSRVLAELYPLHPRTNLVFAGCYGLCYVSWVCLCVASLRWAGLAGLASTVFVVQGSLLAMVRSGFRARYNIRSNMFADVIASTLLWPQVLSQLSLSCGTQLVIDETSLGKTQVALCTRGA